MRGYLYLLIAVGVAIFAVVAVAISRAELLDSRQGAGPPVALAGPVPIDANAAAQHLGQAVRFKTVSHQDPREDDPSQWQAQRDWLQATYPSFHGAATRELVGGALLYTWKGSDAALPPIVLMAHQDVVPVTPGTEARWKAPPFSGAILDGAVWGRGSIDDKGSLIAIMEAAEALASQGFHPRRTVIVVSGEHEETNGGSTPKVGQLLASRGVHALFALDEGMAILQDAPGTGKPAAFVGVAEKGYATLRVTAKGPGGHSSTPPKVTPVVTLARAVIAIADHRFPMRYDGLQVETLHALAPQMPFANRLAAANGWLFGPLLVRRIGDNPGGAAMLHTTIAPTMLRGSPKENVLPEAAIAWINYRIAPGDTTADVMGRARGAVKGLPVDLAWEGRAENPSPVASTNSPGYRAIAALIQDMAHVPVAPALVVGATDSRYMAPITPNIYKFQFVDVRPSDMALIHGTNEHLSIKNLAGLTEFYARLIKTVAS